MIFIPDNKNIWDVAWRPRIYWAGSRRSEAILFITLEKRERNFSREEGNEPNGRAARVEFCGSTHFLLRSQLRHLLH